MVLSSPFKYISKNIRNTLIFIIVLNNIVQLSLQNETEASIKMLACAAVSKKMAYHSDLMEIFNIATKKFSDRINHDTEQTKNFVNLLILNHCNKVIDFSTASNIIKQRADKGDIDASYLSLLGVKTVFEDYISLTDDEKRDLFKDLAVIKEQLKGLSDSISKLGAEARGGSAGGNDFGSKASDSEFDILKAISNMLNFYKEIIKKAFTENTIIFIGIVLVFVITSLGNCKIRRKKVKKVE